ncbi:MAG: hypothetical protein ACFFC7_25685 [Candidatus Hermodarchaeota archaeon]
MSDTNLDFSTVMFELLDEEDPIKLSLWLIIAKYPGITAKEIKQKIYLKGTSIYYYLKQLEEKKFINIKKEQVRNLVQKKYYLPEHFFIDQEVGFYPEMQEESKKSQLLGLYFKSLLLEHQINRINLEIKDQSQEIPKVNMFGRIFLVDESIIPLISKKFEEIQKIVEEQIHHRSLKDLLKNSTHGLIIGYYPFL